jgi:hypothetical protein
MEMKKALYGMLQSSWLYYKKFWRDLKEIGFEINSYNPCVTNRIVNLKNIQSPGTLTILNQVILTLKSMTNF